ncbi:predicted protein [Thalassiosira pseudonana CCMP1335]|uniref:Ubiquitin-like domain-containing protein n=1 Tax=Thalassiosira pseudonana TaxID=35128 RepID=B8BXQ7_THAPS|nr:predicted protein [Thalassiosira pseudonana CCMP1335]EED93749.1 predicted protein [Thalassiosira pseudonana CCMP1335]
MGLLPLMFAVDAAADSGFFNDERSIAASQGSIIWSVAAGFEMAVHHTTPIEFFFLCHSPPFPLFSSSIAMQVIVTAPTGASSAYAVEGATTVSDLKAMIENQEFIPGHLIRLVAGDSELTGGTLAGNGIEEDEELSLLLEIPGVYFTTLAGWVNEAFSVRDVPAMEEPTDGASQQHLQQPTNTRRSKRRVAVTTSLVLIVLSGLFFFTELRGLKLSNYLKNESDAEKSPVVVVVQTEAVEKDIQEKRPKRNRKNEKKARGPAAAARADHNNADDDASTEPSDIRTHIMNQLPDIRAFTKSQPSPVCHPHMQLAMPGFKWFNASKFTRLYFYHARKAGGTSLADYFVKVAHHHGLEFKVDEWTAAEEPSTSDKETFYVAHLREPIKDDGTVEI